MTIASDEYSKFLEIDQNGQNGGSTYLQWGPEIFLNAEGEPVLEDGTYDVHFEYSIKNSGCNQYNSAITIFTNNTPGANQPYRNRWSPAGYWQNYLFDASQVDNKDLQTAEGVNNLLYSIYGGTITNESTNEETGEVTYSYSINYEEYKQLATSVWYEVDLHVDVNARTVEYTVQTNTGYMIQEGVYNVPETNIADGSEISMYAEGMNIMLARTATTYDIDNIKVSYESDQEVANPPVISLVRIGKDENDNVDLNLRAYSISFMPDETLHLIGTNGEEITEDYDSWNGAYVYETTKSGVLKAWTTMGEATSEVVEREVECVPVALPAVTATITSVSEGFGKTYTLTVSNAEVELQPTIFIDYEFTGVNGEKISAEGVASGVKVNVTEEGTLSITSAAFGYQSTTVNVVNDVEFKQKNKYDFAHMTDEEIKAAGFPDYQILNSDEMSGFKNWTARKRLYYLLEGSNTVDEEGNEVWTNVYPFGFISAEDTENVLYYTELDVEGEVATNVAGYELFPGLNVYAGHNVSYIKHIGVYNNATTGGNNKNIDVLNLDETDFVVINKINNYGGNSVHPVCATNDEYYAQLAGEDEVYRAVDGTLNEETGKYTVSCPVWRVDTAATCVTVFAQVGAGNPDAVETISVAGDSNWYSIDGVRVAEPTRPGLYIHNGKKVIVK